MGAEYLSYVKSIATFAPTFHGYTISVLASVYGFISYLGTLIVKPNYFKQVKLGLV